MLRERECRDEGGGVAGIAIGTDSRHYCREKRGGKRRRRRGGKGKGRVSREGEHELSV